MPNIAVFAVLNVENANIDGGQKNCHPYLVPEKPVAAQKEMKLLNNFSKLHVTAKNLVYDRGNIGFSFFCNPLNKR